METIEQKKERAKKIVKILKKEFPGNTTVLKYTTPLELLIATILSAQCTDTRVNQVTEKLFKKYKTARDYALADTAKLEKDIFSTGFYKDKTKRIKNCCRQIVEEFNNTFPEKLEDLVKLSGVGRKTANVVLSNAFDQPAIVVDTHVKRVSNRLKLSTQSDPVKIEFELMDILPRKDWTIYSYALIGQGRTVCKARSPWCTKCKVESLCLFGEKNLS